MLTSTPISRYVPLSITRIPPNVPLTSHNVTTKGLRVLLNSTHILQYTPLTRINMAVKDFLLYHAFDRFQSACL